MNDEDLGRRLEDARTTADHRLAQLEAASTRLYDLLTKEGGRSQQAAANWLSTQNVEVVRSTISKLRPTRDRESWDPPKPGLYGRFTESDDPEVAALGRECAVLRADVDAARAELEDLKRAVEKYHLKIAVDQTETDAFVNEVRGYLQALHKVLGRTPSWHPHAVVDAGFLERKVTMVADPARELHRIAMPTQLYGAPNQIVEGRVAWREAITATRIAVVLADAGYGKSWLLKLYGRMLCQEALDRLDSGELLANVPLPVWLHAADLASRWPASDGPVASVVDAVGTVTAETGYVPSPALREVLAARLTRSGPDLHVLVDAYDEVFDDNDHLAAGRALRWLASLTTTKSGPRIVLSSRPSGYRCPFAAGAATPAETSRPANPRYLLLGALSEDQVTELWQRWYDAKRLPYPADRLDPVLRPSSRMREFSRVPLVATFCALVAETAPVRPTRAGAYDQVMATFLSLAWKEDDRPPRGTGPARDPAQQAAWDRALEDLAWGMATDPRGWCDAIDAAACEDLLAARGPAPGDRESRSSRLVREHGILVMLGGTVAGLAAKIMWIHRSVHEFLAARRLVGLPADEGRAVVEMIATSPQWAGVRDFAWELRSE